MYKARDLSKVRFYKTRENGGDWSNWEVIVIPSPLLYSRMPIFFLREGHFSLRIHVFLTHPGHKIVNSSNFPPNKKSLQTTIITRTIIITVVITIIIIIIIRDTISHTIGYAPAGSWNGDNFVDVFERRPDRFLVGGNMDSTYVFLFYFPPLF